MGFPGGSSGKECRRCGLDPWAGKISGEGNGNPLQYSCLGNPMDRGARWTSVHGVVKVSDTWAKAIPMLQKSA